MPIRAKRNMYAFGHTILVVCPQCSERATVVTQEGVTEPTITLACSHCGFTQGWQRPQHEIRLQSGHRWVGRDNYPKALISAPAGYGGSTVYISVGTALGFAEKLEGVSLRLWLQSRCEGETLWFLNGEHLASVERYVQVAIKPSSASSNERSRGVEEWIKRAENKGRVLECIRALKAT